MESKFKVGRNDIYLWLDGKLEIIERSFYSCTSVDDEGHTIVYDNDRMYRVMKHKRKWVLHCDSSWAVRVMVEGGYYYVFFVNGLNYRIEDLPTISDEEKVVLLLKYSLTNSFYDGILFLYVI